MFNKRFARHIVFWAANLALYCSTSIVMGEPAGRWLPLAILRFMLLAGLVYTNLNWLVPKYLLSERYSAYALRLLAGIGVFTAIFSGLEYYYINRYLSGSRNVTWAEACYGSFLAGLFFIIISSTIKFTLESFRQRKRARNLEVTNLKNELLYLKAQMNPHFLFNSINSIYASIDKRNDTARKMLLKFSDILRYQLYECDDDYVPYAKEVNYLNSYAELQKSRKNQNVKIEYCF